MISVIICTYNRERYITRAIGRLTETACRDYEVLVVDNNCTDGTAALVDSFMKDHPELPIRYLHEKKQGLSNARNCAIAQSRGDLLVFLDDDAFVVGDYLCAVEEFAASHPEADAFGGPIEPLFEDCPRPEWLCRWNMGWVSAYDMGSKVKVFPSKVFPFGGNSAVRRRVIDKIGVFDPELGRKGGNMDAGEEKDFFRRVRQDGGTILYFPKMKIHHVITAARTTMEYVDRFADGVGISERRRTKADGTYKRRLLSEAVKWGGTLVLFVWYLITFRPACGATLVRFRVHVTRELLSSGQ